MTGGLGADCVGDTSSLVLIEAGALGVDCVGDTSALVLIEASKDGEAIADKDSGALLGLRTLRCKDSLFDTDSSFSPLDNASRSSAL